LMATEGRLAYIEEIAGVESAVSMEIECRAVQCVGAGLRDRIDDAPRAPAVFGRISIGQNGKLADRIDSHVDAQSASRAVIRLVVYHQAIHAIDVLVSSSP